MIFVYCFESSFQNYSPFTTFFISEKAISNSICFEQFLVDVSQYQVKLKTYGYLFNSLLNLYDWLKIQSHLMPSVSLSSQKLWDYLHYMLRVVLYSMCFDSTVNYVNSDLWQRGARVSWPEFHCHIDLGMLHLMCRFYLDRSFSLSW